GQLVPRTVAPFLVLRAHRVVDRARGHANACRSERNLLPLTHLLPYLALLGTGLAEYERSGDVGLVTVHAATAVHQHHFAVAHRLRLAGAVWIGAGLAEQDQRELGIGAERLVRAVHHRADVGGRHAAFDARADVPVRGDGDVGGLLHERDFIGRLGQAAGAHHVRAAHDVDL